MEKLNGKENIIECYNCNRPIDISGLKENVLFKCQECFTTISTNNNFNSLRRNMIKGRNRWIIFGMVVGILPMIFVMSLVTIRPLEIVSFFIVLGIIGIVSIRNFMKIASDIIIGILFSEVAIFAYISDLTLYHFSNPKVLKELPDLDFQIYLFFLAGIILMFLGFINRRNSIMR